jgi:hypothetical protein
MPSKRAKTLCAEVLTKPRRSARLFVEKLVTEHYPKLEASEVIDWLISEDHKTPDGLELLAYHLTPYEQRHGSDRHMVVFWPEDFGNFFFDVAQEAGIDLERFGRKLDPKAKHPEHVPAFAFRTVAEIARVYRENPGALTEFRVPRSFLIIMTSAIIGVATGKAAGFDPIIAGAVGGMGSLLLNILAQRYSDDADPTTDWLEEYVLSVLETQGQQSVESLYSLTHIYKPLLTRTLRGLVKKHLVEQHRTWSGGRRTFYDIPRRH